LVVFIPSYLDPDLDEDEKRKRKVLDVIVLVATIAYFAIGLYLATHVPPMIKL